MFESSKKSIYLVSKGRRLDSLERSWNQDKSGKVKGSQSPGRGPKWAVAIWHPKNIYCCRKVLKTRLDKIEALLPWKWSWKWDKLTESRYMQRRMQRNQVHSIVRYRLQRVGRSTMHGEAVRFLWNFESQKHAVLISLWCCTQSPCRVNFHQDWSSKLRKGKVNSTKWKRAYEWVTTMWCIHSNFPVNQKRSTRAGHVRWNDNWGVSYPQDKQK